MNEFQKLQIRYYDFKLARVLRVKIKFIDLSVGVRWIE